MSAKIDDADAERSRNVAKIKDKWVLLPAYIRSKGFIKQHIDSYNHFIKVEIRQIIRSKMTRLIRSDIDPNFFLEFLDCQVGLPRLVQASQNIILTPMQCRLRDLTYNAPILVDMEYYCGGKIIRRMQDEIGRMPVMLGSCICWTNGQSQERIIKLNECPLDPGGYFIVKGSEKAILMQEQISKNRIIVEKDTKKNYCATVSSLTNENKSRTQLLWKNSRLYLKHNSFNEELPAIIVLKALNIVADQEILQLVDPKGEYIDRLNLSIQEATVNNIRTQRDALLYVGSRLRPKTWMQENTQKTSESIIEEVVEQLHRVVISHIETSGNDYAAKAKFVCLMIRKLFSAIDNEAELDDKDYFGNKRLELAGQLLALQFEDKFKLWRDEYKRRIDESLRKYISKKSTTLMKNDLNSYPDIIQYKPLDTITKGLQNALSTGNWNIKRFRMEKTGVSQVLSRFSYVAALGMMTRLVASVEKGMKLARPRWLQSSQWGVICPCDTPEGESIGLVKNLSLMTQVTTDENDEPLKELASILGVEDGNFLTGEEIYDLGTYVVILNGTFIGIHRCPKQFISNWRKLRRAGNIGCFISIYYNAKQQSIYIATDGGRLCRPLIIVENEKPKITNENIELIKKNQISFIDLMQNGTIEWIDVNEHNNIVIALDEAKITKETTHLEIDPFSIMGVVSGLIPYPHHNQSPRNTYQCAMGKQAMGILAHNQFLRADNVLYLLVYPQKQLCKTRTIELAGLDQLPAGQTASVAIMSYSGYDIEDALVFNRASIDRGFGLCYVFKRYTVELDRYGGYSDKILAPPEPKVIQNVRGSKLKTDYRYEVLDSDGVASVGAIISQDQIYLNKGVPILPENVDMMPNAPEKVSYQSQPVKYKTPNHSFVDRVVLTENSEDKILYKFIFRQTRRPEYGDKFSSRHGQKGVVGMIADPENLPFAEDGWTPDMIMNPHGFPSRMTVGKLLELIAGKSALIDGELKYGTAFGATKIEDIASILCGSGYHYSGKEYLTNGITGEPIESYIFSGPIFYQKLKHMVEDKIHARGIGPRQLLTRQPTEGRAKMGGLRLGEMERDCLVAYGGSNLILERLMLSSDAFKVDVCAQCGLIGHSNYCNFCKSNESMGTITIPYACKLLFQELIAMNVVPKLRISQVC